MARRFLGNSEVKRTRKTSRGKILVKLLKPSGKTIWKLYEPDEYDRLIRREPHLSST